MEIRADEKLPIIEQVKQVVEQKQAMLVGGMLLDMFSASLVMSMYDRIESPEVKRKFESLPVEQMVHICLDIQAKQ